jgi:opacity protein-like surface antigen
VYKPCVLLSCVVLFMTQLIFAQNYPKAEVFGGYSYLHIDSQAITGSTLDAVCNNSLGAGTCPPGSFAVHPNFNGWNASVQANVNRWFGIKADFSGHYGTPVTVNSQLLTSAGITGTLPKAKSYSYLFGPVISGRSERFTVYGHSLFGLNDVSATLNSANISGFSVPGFTASDTAFGMALGGGIDATLHQNLALRLIQADYLFTAHNFSEGIQGVAVHQNNVRISAGIVYRFGNKTTTSANQPQAIPSSINIPKIGIAVVTSENGGAKIVFVAHGGLAELAGLKVGDVITEIDENVVQRADDLNILLSKITASTVHITYLIRGAWQTKIVLTITN